MIKLTVTVDIYGNTSAASIPMAMNYAFEQGRIKAEVIQYFFDAFWWINLGFCSI